MPESLTSRYRRLIERNALSDDAAQALAVEKLQLLANRLAHYSPPSKTDFFSFFTRKRGEVPKGLYLYGGVGRGKTLLMNLFFEAADISKKRRVHFHEFMGDIHARLRRIRERGGEQDAVLTAAEEVASETQLLCLDELFVIDIADATILMRLFQPLFERGVVVVATSNAHPTELYKDGRNRELFLPFIDLVEENLEILHLAAARDYRQQHIRDTDLYFTPLNDATKARMDALWTRLTLGEPCSPETLTVLGHPVHVPRVCVGLARFSWSDLFQKPLGPQDYLAIARRYRLIFLDHVPVLSPERRDEARRFITFIDETYDQGTALVISAEDEPDRLYTAGDGALHFERTASRLTEMRSADYLARSRHAASARLIDSQV